MGDYFRSLADTFHSVTKHPRWVATQPRHRTIEIGVGPRRPNAEMAENGKPARLHRE
jgi:hypothetical protein